MRHLEAAWSGTAALGPQFTSIRAALEKQNAAETAGGYRAGDRNRRHGIGAKLWAILGYGPQPRGYYASPYNGGPLYGNGGGQYYGPNSYARRVPASRYCWR
jgi:hypothetical protein